MSLFDPLFDAELIAIQAGMAFNYGEFAIIKIWVVDLFPYPKEFDGVSVSQPVRNEKVPIFRLEHIRQGNIILVIYGCNCNFCSVDNQFVIHSGNASIAN